LPRQVSPVKFKHHY